MVVGGVTGVWNPSTEGRCERLEPNVISFRSCFADKKIEIRGRSDFHSEVGESHGIRSSTHPGTPIWPFQKHPFRPAASFPCLSSLANELQTENHNSLHPMGASHWAPRGGHTVSPHRRKIKCLEFPPWIEPRWPCPLEGYSVRRVRATVRDPASPQGRRRRQGKAPELS